MSSSFFKSEPSNLKSSRGPPESPKNPVNSSESKNGKKTLIPSFIIKIKELSPKFDDGSAKPQANTTKHWDPPKSSKHLLATNSRYFRWYGGRVTSITSLNEMRTYSPLPKHSVASMFSQEEGGDLLGVYLDASEEDVKNSNYGSWRRLRFNKVDGSGRTFSYLDFAGERNQTVGTLQNHLVPQLLPDKYNPRRQDGKNEGLVGRLPILIGVAAFSIESQGLAQALTQCILPQTWAPHYSPNGRDDPPYRGIVVTICYDITNPRGSNKQILKDLEDGVHGPFYGPNKG